MLRENENQGIRRPSRTPDWWSEEHESGWDRVKAALKRDWEQTKSDFSGGRSGEDLNQDVDDTVRQAAGKEAVPPMGVPNAMDADDVEKSVKKAERQMDKQEERYRDGAEKTAKKQKKAAKKNERAAASSTSPSRERGWGRYNAWEEAEIPLRYGYGAATHYAKWDEGAEQRMRQEWSELYPDSAWDDVRDTIRTGWDRARPH